VYAGGTTQEIWGYLEKKIIDTEKGKKHGSPKVVNSKKIIITKSDKILLENDPKYNGNETNLINQMLKKWGKSCLNTQDESNFSEGDKGFFMLFIGEEFVILDMMCIFQKKMY